MFDFVFVLVFLLCSYRLGWLAVNWYLERKKKMLKCVHEVEYVSLYNLGIEHEWKAKCRKCPHEEHVRDPELCKKLTAEYWEKRRRR
jgi:hypothetical protein